MATLYRLLIMAHLCILIVISPPRDLDAQPCGYFPDPLRRAVLMSRVEPHAAVHQACPTHDSAGTQHIFGIHADRRALMGALATDECVSRMTAVAVGGQERLPLPRLPC